MTEEQENSRQLPKGWAQIVLGDHINIAGRIGWRGLKKEEYLSQGPLLLAVKDILENGSINYNVADHLSEFRYEESPEIQLRDQDVLITKDGTIGKVGFVENLPGKVTVNSSILVVRPSSAIFRKFLFYYFRGPKFQDIVRKKIEGTAVPHLFQHDINQFLLHIPPFLEQRRIVAKVEELFTRLDAGVKSLKKVKMQLKRYHQAVLKYAFEGKLTEEWRKTHKDQIEPPTTLQEDLEAGRGEVPEKWKVVTVADVCFSIRKGVFDMRPQNYVKQGIPFLRISDIENGSIALNNTVFIPEDIHEKERKTELTCGDLIISKVGTLNKIAVVPPNIKKCNISQNLVGIKAQRSRIEPLFLFFLLNTDQYARKLTAFSHVTTLKALRLSTIRTLRVPLPSLDEQRKIVEILSRCFSIIDKTNDVVNQNLRWAERLRESILKRAFEGKLLPQDPTDEPAEKLLARIKEEKAKHENKTNNRSYSKEMGLIHYVE